MKPGFAIAIAIIIVLAVVLVGFGYKFVSDRAKLIADTKKDIQTANQIEYRSLKCLSLCPLVVENKTHVVFEGNCTLNCIKNNPIPQAVIKKFFGSLLMESEGHRVCIKMIDSSVNYTSYRDCLVEFLNRVPDVYPYLKEI